MKTIHFLEYQIEILKENVKEADDLHDQLLKCIRMFAQVSMDYPKALQILEEQINQLMDQLKKSINSEQSLHQRLFEYIQMHNQLSEDAKAAKDKIYDFTMSINGLEFKASFEFSDPEKFVGYNYDIEHFLYQVQKKMIQILDERFSFKSLQKKLFKSNVMECHISS